MVSISDHASSLQRSLGMENLSDDILLHCLEFVPIQDVFTCRKVCARLRLLIDSSALLRYRFELYESNMMDFVPRTVPLNVCNERLFEYKRGWRRLNLTPGERISYPLVQTSGDPVRGTTIKLQGNTLVAYSYFTGDAHFAQLPSKSRGMPFSEWTLKIPGPRRLINLACDPVQDLLLYLEMCNPHDRYSGLQLRACSLRKGTPHPHGGLASLDKVAPRAIKASYMTIRGSHIAFFRPDEPWVHPNVRIMVWNWKTGTNVLDIETPGGPGGECVFLSERYILVGEVRKNPHKAYLNVVDIHDPANPVRCKFQLPRLAYFERSYISLSSCRRTGVTFQESVLFAEDPTETVVYANILVKEILGLFVLAGRLVRLAEARPGEIIPWEDWGPDNARFINLDYDGVNPYTGANVEIIGTKALVVQKNKLVLYDFNQRSIKRELARNRKSKNIVTRPTDSSDWTSFEQGVVTCLPYRLIHAPVCREDVRQWKSFYASEDGIVIEPELEFSQRGIEFYSI